MVEETILVYEDSLEIICSEAQILSADARVSSHSSSPDGGALMQLLSMCLPLVKAAMATAALLDRYGNYADVVAAPLNELQAIARLGEHGARLLKCVHTATIHLAAAPLQRGTSVDDWASLFAYLNTSMARERSEFLRVLFLDSKNHVISNQILSRGTINFIDVSIRDIVHISLQVGAAAILILHNHPSGDPTPSPEDVEMTDKIKEIMCSLGVRLHDHIVIGKGRCFSFKNMKFLPSDLGGLKLTVAAAA